MVQQTAVLWLQQAMTTHLTFEQAISFDGLFQQALDMEKQQIMDAWMDGYDELDPFIDKSEDYYYNHFVDPNKKPDQV